MNGFDGQSLFSIIETIQRLFVGMISPRKHLNFIHVDIIYGFNGSTWLFLRKDVFLRKNDKTTNPFFVLSRLIQHMRIATNDLLIAAKDDVKKELEKTNGRRLLSDNPAV